MDDLSAYGKFVAKPNVQWGPKVEINKKTKVMTYRGLELTEQEVHFLHDCYRSFNRDRAEEA